MNTERNLFSYRIIDRLPLSGFAWLLAAAVALGLGLLLSAGVAIPAASMLMLGAVIVAASLGSLRSGLLAGLAGALFEIFASLAEHGLAAGAAASAVPGVLLMLCLGPYVGALRGRRESLPLQSGISRTRILPAIDDAARFASPDTQELDLVRERLVTSQDRLRDVTKRWIDAQESERRKLSRQLHDDIGQSLTALRINLESNKDRFASDESAKQFIESAYELVDCIIASVRDLSLSLRPSLLDDFGLGAALREHVCQQLKRSGIHCKLRVNGDDSRLDESHAVAAYRIIQEYMAGVQQRGRADTVVLDVDFGAENLEISIREKGVRELDAESVASVRERAMLIGGTLDMLEDRHGDSRLEISIPYPSVSAGASAS